MRYLSDEWIEAVARTVAEADELRTPAAGSLVVDHVVGDDAYHVTVGPGGVRVGKGRAERADVVITQDHETAAAIARGELNAQQAFISGRVRFRGDVDRLIAAQAVFAALDRLLAPVRAVTVHADHGERDHS